MQPRREQLQRKGQSRMFVWRERTIEEFYLRRTSDSSQVSRVQIRKTQENAHLPVLLPLMRRVSQIARLSQRGLKDSASTCEHERVKENKKTCWSGKERLIFFPCYILILYILLKFYFCMFYFMYHFGNVFCCCCCCCCSTNTVCL